MEELFQSIFVINTIMLLSIPLYFYLIVKYLDRMMRFYLNSMADGAIDLDVKARTLNRAINLLNAGDKEAAVALLKGSNFSVKVEGKQFFGEK